MIAADGRKPAWAQSLFMVYLKTKKRTDISQIQAGFKAF